MRSLGAASFRPSMGIPVCRERRATKRPTAASSRASRGEPGALASTALNVASSVSLPVPGRTVTGSGINAGAAAKAEEIKVTDNANRSISSIVVPHYAISGNGCLTVLGDRQARSVCAWGKLWDRIEKPLGESGSGDRGQTGLKTDIRETT